MRHRDGAQPVPASRQVPKGSAVLIGYIAMVCVSVAAFLLIRHFGNGIAAPPGVGVSPEGTAAPSAPPRVLEHLLLAMATIVICSRMAGVFFQRLHQPPVIGEVLAGILLGPSLLGRVAPDMMAFVFPSFVLPALSAIAQFGVVLFMFLIGLELNTDSLRERTHTTLAISHASILFPFVLGSLLALYLYPHYSLPGVSFTAFALFMGVSMSVTAFPVLARILTDRAMHRTRMGIIALTCAAVDDVTAWCLLAFVVGVIQSHLGGAILTVVLTLLYIALMFLVLRPFLIRFTQKVDAGGVTDQQVMAMMSIGLLLSCLATETIGIHALFGAFLFGAIIPHDSSVAHTLTAKLHDFVVVMLLPAFFALTGLRTQMSLISGAGWLICLLIILVAFAGKFGGSTVAARLTGLGWRDAATLGILMNTRGLVELIVLNVGLDLKVISPRLFAMLVIMAVVTTFATAPILDMLTSQEGKREGNQ